MSSPQAGDARLAAVAAIAAVLDDHRSLGDHFQSVEGLSERDQAFAQHLAYGVLRWLTALEWLAAQLLNKPLRRKERDIQRLVLIGLYQIWKDDTADHAAVHAPAECAKKLGKKWATGLVNALLRRFQREKDTWLERLARERHQYAHPPWLLTQLEQDWPNQWTQIADQNNEPAALWLRVNRLRSDPDSLIGRIRKDGLESGRHGEAGDAVFIQPAVAVQRIPGFLEGLVSVQDPAAQLAVDLVAPVPGDRILDACAAPGGKTCHLLERQPDIDLLALDRDAQRIRLISENLDRLGLECRVENADAGKPDDWWDSKPFDKILLDAPCSTTGVIRRHPDIKWLRDAEQVENAVRIQRKLLDRLWPLLGTGGILVYATCSILKCENHMQIHGFLSRHANAELAGPEGEPATPELPGRQILPGQEGMDGFYYAVLRKSG